MSAVASNSRAAFVLHPGLARQLRSSSPNQFSESEQPAFDGSRVLAAILLEQTMERDVYGDPTARYLWDEKNVVPFLKFDNGLAPGRTACSS
jgi:hypothetical protein